MRRFRLDEPENFAVYDEAIAHAHTPHIDRYYPGDMVTLKQGVYSNWWLSDGLNPAGSVRQVVMVEERDGRRITWIQLELRSPKRCAMDGWVAPAHDEMELYARPKENEQRFADESAYMN